MRKLGTMEILFRESEIRAIATAVSARVHGGPTPAAMFEYIADGTLHVWEHEGVLALAQVHIENGDAVARVAYAAGSMASVLAWYAAWEAECRRYQVDYIFIGGRRGWLKVSDRLGLGYVPVAGGILKSLH